MMILLRLCFGALLGFLDGLRQSAFAQMKLSEFLDGFPVGFGVINEHSADHIAEAQQSLGSAADDDIVTVLQRKRKQVSAFARDWPSPIRLWMILRVNIRRHHLNHPASARARRQGPVLPDLRGKRQHIIAIFAFLMASQLWGQTTVNGSWWFNQGANAGIDSGTANAYVVSTPTDFKYVEPTFLCFLPANTNTGASTLTLGMLTPLTIQKSGNTALAGSEITANQPACGMYDGAGHFELLGGTSSGGSITLSANSLYGNPTGSSAAGTSISYLPPNILQNYITYKFPETAAPGAIAGNEPMDIVVDSTHNTVYICAIVAGTSAPACSAVGLSNWLQLATLPGTQTFSGTDTFSGALNFTGLTTGTQADCVGITSMGAVVLSSGACGTGGSPTWETNSTSLGAQGTGNFINGSGILVTGSSTGGVASITISPDTSILETRVAFAQGGDISCIDATGSSTAYTCNIGVTSGVVLTQNMVVNFVPQTTSGANPTLAVNGLAALALDWDINGTLTPVTTGQLTGGIPYKITAYGSGPTAWVVTPQLFFANTGANTALSNLAAVSINTSLLAQTTVDLGSTSAPFRNLYLYGGGTFGTDSFELTGTSTANRTVTFPDNTGTVAELNLPQTFSGLQTFGSNASIAATAHGVLLSENTSAVAATAVGGANFPLIGQTSADPVWSTIAYPTSLTSGGFLYASSTTGIAGSALITANVLPKSGGAGTAPAGSGITDSGTNITTSENLLVTGVLDGDVPVTITTGTSATLGASTYQSGYTLNQEGTAGTGVTYTLPATVGHMQYCVANSGTTGVVNIGVLTIYPPSGSYVILNGVVNTVGGGGTHGVVSGGAAGDSACFVAIDSTHWQVFPGSGTWTEN